MRRLDLQERSTSFYGLWRGIVEDCEDEDCVWIFLRMEFSRRSSAAKILYAKSQLSRPGIRKRADAMRPCTYIAGRVNLFLQYNWETFQQGVYVCNQTGMSSTVVCFDKVILQLVRFGDTHCTKGGEINQLDWIKIAYLSTVIFIYGRNFSLSRGGPSVLDQFNRE